MENKYCLSAAGALSDLRQYLPTESHYIFENHENCFLFHFKGSFCS